MAYMDNRCINQKTFLHCPDIGGEIELNEILELLCQYSLVMRQNYDYLEIHNLVQKVIQIQIQRNRFIDGANPKESLEKILTSVSSSVDSDDISYSDNENIWCVHFIKLIENVDDPDLLFEVNVKLLADIANRRHDRITLLWIFLRFIPFLLEKYKRTRNLDDFLVFIHVHRMLLPFGINVNLTTEEIIQLEQEFAEELKSEHRLIFLWKIQLACFYQNNKNFKRSEAICSELFKQLVNKEGFVDVKLDLCSSIDFLHGERLLEQINESHLESNSSKLMYYSPKYYQYLREKNFDESEKWSIKFEQKCKIDQISYYEPQIVFDKVWLLYWKLQFNEALNLLEGLDEWIKHIYGDFNILKALLLLKLGKYDEAESL